MSTPTANSSTWSATDAKENQQDLSKMVDFLWSLVLIRSNAIRYFMEFKFFIPTPNI